MMIENAIEQWCYQTGCMFIYNEKPYGWQGQSVHCVQMFNFWQNEMRRRTIWCFLLAEYTRIRLSFPRQRDPVAISLHIYKITCISISF